MQNAFREYIADVKEGRFPSAEHANTMDPQALRDLIREISFLEPDVEPDDKARYH